MQCKVKGSSLVADVLVSWTQGKDLETAAFKIGEGGASRDRSCMSARFNFQTTKKTHSFFLKQNPTQKKKKLPLNSP